MAELSSILIKYKKQLESVARKSAIELGARIKDGTPIDTGKARGSWSDNGPLVIGKLYKYSSNLSYIRPLEYGHSAQAPHGMVRINTIKWDSIVSKYAKAS